MTKVLYLSYDGITDPLGQSQILPYLKGLSQKGYFFYLVGFEKKDAYKKQKEGIENEIRVLIFNGFRKNTTNLLQYSLPYLTFG